ncbi:uracil-DNA glycosylase [Roseomonas gilardii subsp. gilardii]|uniref:uracil-DNA glycosylase n=1 Tax=Roseomonas gilardii TaxID=257708 RepID=UPI001FF9B233|nr:uracil-DNA glycosylase [Roseomonas gilardii]UPG72605.1 uracil-DNA glycosylase [Roseomonas gilardii subsp. gilardii]
MDDAADALQDGNASREALLAALSLQLAWGVDEALEAAPLDRTVPRPEAAIPRVAPGSAPAGPSMGRGADGDGLFPGEAAPPAARRPPPRPAEVLAPAALRAADLAAGAESLEALKAAMERFDASLRDTATNIVFSDGVAESGLMLIGEAPGADEDRLGKPFVGVSGRLLDRMVASIGLDRSRNFYLTNILCWRPPGNRTPTDAEVSLFLPFARRHIALARPRHVVLLGGTAAKALLGAREGITRLRGRWHRLEIEGLGTVPALATLHPAYLLRQPSAKREAWQDLLMLRRALDGETPKGF